MQRARRFICSNASRSSQSNSTLRTRKRSRESSAIGDSLAVNRGPGSFGDASGERSKNRAPKGNSSNKLKSLRKPARALRPSYGSLQNTVVLAPFHTLKRCFQSKLLDLYSLEKMKKINQKTKMAKKQNMSFEYDVIELKSPTNVKKDSKAMKKTKSRSASYCQCNKTASKAGSKKSQNAVQKKRVTGSESRTSRGAFRELAAKRRKLNGPTPMILKAELSPRLNLYPTNEHLAFSDAMPSASGASSRSKCDSWETYSNSASYKEEHLEGSLAISTTSFDSYLERFDKSSLGLSDSSWRGSRRLRSRVTPERLAADFHPKPNAESLRQSVGHFEKKNSDDQIVDFMDREPQTQKITESNQHLQPLQRQSKTKAKKSETEPGASYYLRSHSSSKEKIPQDRKSSRGSAGVKARTLQIEVATQVGENILEEATGFLKSIAREMEKTSEDNPCDPDEESIPEEKVQSPDSEYSCEIPLTTREPVEPQQDVASSPSPPPPSSLELNPLVEHSDRPSIELMAGLQDRPQRPADSQQPQDKDTSFIFGHGTTPSRLGESCQFSFGLK